MHQEFRPNPRVLYPAAAALILLLAACAPLRAQSGDAGSPTPVFSGEVGGRILPRDVGDPRRTRHFYTFRGTEGDLEVRLETSQLIGDVDVFTATTLRPLVKFTLFGDPSSLSKSFYLRKEETLVLRVEARAVGDAEGTYTIRFGGSFAPAPAELANAPETSAPTLSPAETRGNTRRVTATGARIDEPRVEPTPAAEAIETRSAATPTPVRPAERRSPTASRRGRGSRPSPSPRPRTGGTATQPGTARPEAAGTSPETDTAAGGASTTDPSSASTPSPRATPRRGGTRSPKRGSSRENAEARRTEPAAPTRAEPAARPPAPVSTQRLIIVTTDGETLERDMGGVRRVTVENNQVVIVGRDGKVTRRPLASVLRMSIEP